MRAMMTLAICAAGLTALSVSSPSRADIVRGDTGTPEAMGRHLRASDQTAVALANREIVRAEENRVDYFATAFTCSSDGSHGYVVEYNAPLGTPPTESRVVARVENCRTFDTANDDPSAVPPSRAYDENAALTKCEELVSSQNLASCGSYSQAIGNSRRLGQRIAFQGDNSNSIDRENFVLNGIFTVTVGGRDEDYAAAWYTTDEGATILYDTYRDFNFTPDQLERFNR